MWRFRVITISMVVVGALFLATTTSLFDDEQVSFTNVEMESSVLPSVVVIAAPYLETPPVQVTVVVPPYIIMNSNPYAWDQSAEQNAKIRISVETIDGLYSEYAASKLIEQKSQQISLIRPHRPGNLTMNSFSLLAYE